MCISDCHIQKVETIFVERLKKAVNDENIDYLFILGDLIDGTVMPPDRSILFHKIIKGIKSIDIPVFIIGGNHDRIVIEELQSKYSDNKTKLITQLAMLLEVPQDDSKIMRIFFAHDLGNNYRVRDKFAISFFDWIKRGCGSVIKSNDWLICAHAHTCLVSSDFKVACIGQFSPDNKRFAYSVININGKKATFISRMLFQ